MGLRDESVMLRHNAIHNALKNGRLGIQQIADSLGVSYHTVRNDLTTLVNEGKVRISVATGDKGERLFMAGSSRPMPEFFHGKQKTDLWEQATTFAAFPSKGQGHAAEAIFTIKHVMLELVRAASTLAAGDSVDQKTLLTWRKAVTDARMMLDMFVSITDQLIKADVWTPEALIKITDDEMFDTHKVVEMYSAFLDVYNKETSND